MRQFIILGDEEEFVSNLACDAIPGISTAFEETPGNTPATAALSIYSISPFVSGSSNAVRSNEVAAPKSMTKSPSSSSATSVTAISSAFTPDSVAIVSAIACFIALPDVLEANACTIALWSAELAPVSVKSLDLSSIYWGEPAQ